MGANLGINPAFDHKSAWNNAGPSSKGRVMSSARRSATHSAVTSTLMMACDVIAVCVALYLAIHLRLAHSIGYWSTTSTLDIKTPMVVQLGYLGWFIAGLLVLNRHDGLYGRLRSQSFLHEQRRTVQVCLTAGLLLCGGLYMTHNTSIPRAVVVYLVLFATVFLCVLRGVWRYAAHRAFERGLETKNVLILGANHVGGAVRKQLLKHRRLGRTFKGFVSTPGSVPDESQAGEVIGNLYQLRHLVRQHFIDEIVIAESCSTPTVVGLVELARTLDIEVLSIPGCFEDMAPEAPIFYLGDFPVVAIHYRDDKAVACLIKRIVDSMFSLMSLIALSPAFLSIGLAIRFSSPGPVFYISDRIGKKGRVFRLWKFRTMVPDVELLKASPVSEIERDGILFKMKNDPRITCLGRFLRKYSLDELPQLLNVLWGDMSLVGPRPPLASELATYELDHFRRLEVLPGLTGLWQVRARHDPSFEQYVALDLAYVENWSVWMDLKILLRTAEVVFRGTGS